MDVRECGLTCFEEAERSLAYARERGAQSAPPPTSTGSCAPEDVRVMDATRAAAVVRR